MTNTVNNASYSAAFQSIMQLMLLPVTDAYGKRVYPHVTNNGDNTVNDYWYPNPLATPAIHAGIDFNYVGGQGPANPANTLPVFSPVTGVVVRTQLEYGGVIIQAADGTYHRILHLDAMNLVEGNSVTAGVTQLGLMSNLGAVTAGQYSGPVHVHYDIFLESNGVSGWQAPIKVNGIYVDQDLRVDPIVYWTRGVNPNANSLTSTGLTVLVTPVNDYNNNGTIDTPDSPGALSESGAFVREGQASILKVGVNTPHTQPLTLRVQFSAAPAGLQVTALSGIDEVRWDNPTALYVTLSATASQSTPNTRGYLQLTLPEDADSTGQTLSYSIEAGYRDSGGLWRSYNNVTGNGAASFTGVYNQTLFLLDTTPPTDPAADDVIVGNDDERHRFYKCAA